MFKWLKTFSKITDPILFGDTEVIPGVETPTRTLAKMVAAKILGPDFNPKDNKAVFDKFEIKWDARKNKRNLTRSEYNSLSAKHNNWDRGSHFKYEDYVGTGYPGYRSAVEASIPSNFFDSGAEISPDIFPNVAFSEADLRIINQALVKGLRFAQHRADLEKASQNQQNALSAIEKFFEVKPQPEPEVPLPLVATKEEALAWLGEEEVK